MPRKPKFNPEITRVKLNPEQAVLQCLCFSTDFAGEDTGERTGWALAAGSDACIVGTRELTGRAHSAAGTIQMVLGYGSVS